MTKLLVRWDPSLRAFVPEAGVDLSTLSADARATVEVEDSRDAELSPLAPFPPVGDYAVTGGPGMTGKEFVEHLKQINREFPGTAFPEPEDAPELARKLRESGR